ncbi:MAG TPA: NAD(P)-dependent oxidoreductase [Burkholderiales bacterium]|nr:NAD(P)-dependent oxidoreductase [Burkholderiales bacterium]
MKLGFVGVGKMGQPMAGHLLNAGHSVAACDLSPALVQAIVARGASAAATPADAARGAEIVFSSLPDDASLRKVAAGVLSGAGPGTVFVDTSTVSPTVSAEVARDFAAKRVPYLRVAVSGNNKMAEQAALTVIASGEKVAYEKCRPLLALFGPSQYYVGEAEQARALKLAINLMVYATVAGLGESLAIGKRNGLDWAQMIDVMAASAIGSPLLKAKSGALKSHDFSATFNCLQARKDLTLINGAAAESGVPAPVAAIAARLIEDCIAGGSAEEDYAAMIKSVERSSK